MIKFSPFAFFSFITLELILNEVVTHFFDDT
jgi:hypothetical protein